MPAPSAARVATTKPNSGIGSSTVFMAQDRKQTMRRSTTAFRPSGVAAIQPMDEPRAGPQQFVERAIDIAGMKVDTGDGVAEDADVKAGTERVERGRPDAVIGGDAGDVESRDMAIAQIAEQCGPAGGMPLERGVTGLRRIVALGDDDRIGRQPQVRVKLRALGPLHAVRRPFAAERLEVA